MGSNIMIWYQPYNFAFFFSEATRARLTSGKAFFAKISAIIIVSEWCLLVVRRYGDEKRKVAFLVSFSTFEKRETKEARAFLRRR